MTERYSQGQITAMAKEAIAASAAGDPRFFELLIRMSAVTRSHPNTCADWIRQQAQVAPYNDSVKTD